jgi:plastocyanin
VQKLLSSWFVVAFGLATVAACGSSGNASAPAPTGSSAAPTTAGSTTRPASDPTITISKDLMFSSRPVRAGTTVTIRNDSAAQHTVSANSAAGGFDATMEPGKTMTFTAPPKPGAYPFHCNIHTFMTGVLQVT